MIDSATASERLNAPRVSVGCPLGVGLRTTAQPARLRRARPLRPRLWSQGSDGAWRARCPPSTRTARPSCCWIGPQSAGGRARAQGFAWSEGRPAKRNVASWKDAACELAACGLVAHRERRRVHSSVSGVAPIYYVEHAGAVYFASRIDPLVRILPRRLHDRLARLGVHLLPPLPDRGADPVPRGQAAAAVQHPGMGCGPPGGEAAPASLAVGRGPAEPRTGRRRRAPSSRQCGRPSRPLREGPSSARSAAAGTPGSCSACWRSKGTMARAVTVSPDNGHHREEELAAEVATASGCRTPPWRATPRRSGTTRASAPCGWTSSSPRRPGRCRWPPRSGDGPAWRPTASGSTRSPRRATHYYTESMIRPDGTPAVAQALWTQPSRPGHAPCDLAHLSPELDDELKALARRQFMAEASRFRGHPAEMVLTFYATRTVRGISLTPHAVLGADVATVTPCTDHASPPRAWRRARSEKFHTRIYRALFAKVNATVSAGFPRPTTSCPPPAISAASARALRRRRPRATSGCSPAGPWNARSAPRSAGISPRAHSARAWPTHAPPRGARDHPLPSLARALSRPLAGDDPLDELAPDPARRAHSAARRRLRRPGEAAARRPARRPRPGPAAAGLRAAAAGSSLTGFRKGSGVT